jgi:hypothetical protein
MTRDVHPPWLHLPHPPQTFLPPKQNTLHVLSKPLPKPLLFRAGYFCIPILSWIHLCWKTSFSEKLTPLSLASESTQGSPQASQQDTLSPHYPCTPSCLALEPTEANSSMVDFESLSPNRPRCTRGRPPRFMNFKTLSHWVINLLDFSVQLHASPQLPNRSHQKPENSWLKINITVPLIRSLLLRNCKYFLEISNTLA